MEGTAGVTKEIPTNAFLYFQTLAGTNGAALNAYHGTAGPVAAAGQAIDPLVNDCSATTGCPQIGVGLTQGFLGSATGNVFYTQNYFCDKSVSAKSSNGCEVGASYSKLPPGTTSAAETDPIYIITPLFSPAPPGLQCPGPCIDHPTTGTPAAAIRPPRSRGSHRAAVSGLRALLDLSQEAEHALQEQCRGALVIGRQAAVREQVLITGVEE